MSGPETGRYRLELHPEDREADKLDPDDIDPGEPIPQLVQLEAAPRRGFLARLRRRIDRRRFAGDTTTFAWSATWALVRQLLDMLFSGGASKQSSRRGDAPDQNR